MRGIVLAEVRRVQLVTTGELTAQETPHTTKYGRPPEGGKKA